MSDVHSVCVTFSDLKCADGYDGPEEYVMCLKSKMWTPMSECAKADDNLMTTLQDPVVIVAGVSVTAVLLFACVISCRGTKSAKPKFKPSRSLTGFGSGAPGHLQEIGPPSARERDSLNKDKEPKERELKVKEKEMFAPPSPSRSLANATDDDAV